MSAARLRSVKKHMIAVVLVAVSLGLAGCSAGNASSGATTAAESEPTPTETKQVPVEKVGKSWSFDYMGATGTFNLSGDQAADPAVAALESARASVNGQQYTFVPVAVDNTSGTSSINMYGLTVVTKDGQQVDSMSLEDVFSSWRDAAGDDTDKYNAIVDVSNTYGQFDLQPGAKGTAVVAFEQPVTSAWRVSVAPAGGSDLVEATAS